MTSVQLRWLAAQAFVTALAVFAVGRLLWADGDVLPDLLDALLFGVVFTAFSSWFGRREA